MNKLKYAPYSNSKINLFYECPLKWKFVYLDKIRVSKPTHYFEKGNFYHFVLQHFPQLPPNKFKFNFADREKQSAFVQNVKDFIKLPEVTELLTKHSVGREVTCNLSRQFGGCEIKKESMSTGYIDYLGQEHPDELIVGDWKSSKNYTPNQFQIDLYALWAFSTTPHIKKVKAGFLYVEDKLLEWQHFERGQDEDRLRKMFINKIRKIEQCKDFKKKPSKNCDYCDYFGTHCKPFNVAVPGV